MVVFFFQAEDGIRDRTVTGVQTCALPISHQALASGSTVMGRITVLRISQRLVRAVTTPYTRWKMKLPPANIRLDRRSEERRVGKECRSQRSLKTKKKHLNSNIYSIRISSK